jgi:hypothetical protein
VGIRLGPLKEKKKGNSAKKPIVINYSYRENIKTCLLENDRFAVANCTQE